MTDERFQQGLKTVSELFPPRDDGQNPRFTYPPEIADDWNTLSISTVMGDIWSRSGLAKNQRAIITIAALTVLDKPEQLKAYITAGLNLGVSRQEICEVIMQMAIYGGFPAAIQGLGIANEVFQSVDDAANQD